MNRRAHQWAKLQWLGIIGFLADIFQIEVLRLFYLFWLFALPPLFFMILAFFKHFPFISQNIHMLLSIPVVPLVHGFKLPDKENFDPKCHYSLPFEGEWYVANGGIDKETSHSWLMHSQRYAYDFIIVDPAEHSYTTNRKSLEDYYCYKANVLAPADGTVIKIANHYEDTPIGEIGEVGCAASDIRGNFVIIQHDKHEYSVTCHLLKGSISVKAGDTVRRGEKIALCGNSGNTSEPHIHFQLQTGKSFVYSAGLPISFTGICCDDHQPNEPCFISRESRVRNC